MIKCEYQKVVVVPELSINAGGSIEWYNHIGKLVFSIKTKHMLTF